MRRKGDLGGEARSPRLPPCPRRLRVGRGRRLGQGGQDRAARDAIFYLFRVRRMRRIGSEHRPSQRGRHGHASSIAANC